MENGEFEDFLDDDGFSEDPIRIFAKVIKQGCDITVDFTGTSRQVKGSINLPIAMTQSSVYACLRSVIDPNLPTNSGFMRPIHVMLPSLAPSSIRFRCPRPSRRAGEPSMRVTEAVWGRAGPDAAEQGARPRRAGRFRRHHRRVSRRATAFRAAGIFVRNLGRGRPNKDAIDALSSLAVNYSNTPVEVVEREQPIRIEQYAMRQDSAAWKNSAAAWALCANIS